MNLILIGPFLILPVIELAVMIKVGTMIGVLPTVALLFLAAMLGTWVMRRQGTRAVADLNRAFAELRDPSAYLADGALVMLAGMLLVVPGFVTDAAGLVLLIPPVRAALMAWAGRRARVRPGLGGTSGAGPRPADWAAQPHRPGGGVIIDAEFVELDTPDGGPAPPRPQGPRGPSGWTRG